MTPMRKKKKAKRAKRGFSFLQDWGTYPAQTLVCVGLGKPEVLKVLRSYGGSDGTGRTMARMADAFDKTVEHDLTKNKGYFWSFEGRSVLAVREYADRWEWWETLMHELHHAVHLINGEERGQEKELEALAYQQEYLFRAIRRRLQGRER